jgi:hypothetical protein
MRNIFLFCFFVIPALSFSEGKDFARPRSYEITERKTDINITPNYSRFTFIVYTNQVKSGGASVQLLHKEKIRLGINQTEKTDFPDWKGNFNQTLESGKYVFYFLVDGFQEVVTDTITLQSKEVVTANIYLQDTSYFNQVIYFKPVIYLYPEKEKNIDVKINVKGNLTVTYPVYNNGWNFNATPEGKLKFDNKIYNYLFWESTGASYEVNLSDRTGFVVSSDTLLRFLENSLEKMNFTAAEAADFITFWYPKLAENDENFIQFVFNEDCDSYAELQITPKPDQVFRLGMIYKKADSDFIPEKQILPTVNRNGFYVIEWGGSMNPLLFRNGY